VYRRHRSRRPAAQRPPRSRGARPHRRRHRSGPRGALRLVERRPALRPAGPRGRRPRQTRRSRSGGIAGRVPTGARPGRRAGRRRERPPRRADRRSGRAATGQQHSPPAAKRRRLPACPCRRARRHARPGDGDRPKTHDNVARDDGPLRARPDPAPHA